jgi:hypothetical protein
MGRTTYKGRLILDAVTAPTTSIAVFPDSPRMAVQFSVTGTATARIEGRVHQHGGQFVLLDQVDLGGANPSEMIVGYRAAMPETRVVVTAISGSLSATIVFMAA